MTIKTVDNAATFILSAEAFLRLLAKVRAEQWELPGLGVWSVRSLAGHTARSILTVENYLSSESTSEVTVPTAEAYYAATAASAGTEADAAAVEARAVAAGQWLGSDPVGQVASALSRVRELLDAESPDRTVTVIGGLAIPLGEYLRTRIFELAVHSTDLSRATGLPSELPVETLACAAVLAAGITVERDQGETLLLALTGRAPLPEGFSVV